MLLSELQVVGGEGDGRDGDVDGSSRSVGARQEMIAQSDEKDHADQWGTTYAVDCSSVTRTVTKKSQMARERRRILYLSTVCAN